MARGKVKLGFIVDDSKRRATFTKRRNGLMKKVSEISTLCGVNACAIILSPYANQADVWPNHSGTHHVISLFQRVPEMERNRYMLNVESFVRQRLVKLDEKLKKQVKDNREMEVAMLMDQCLGGRSLRTLTMDDLNDLGEMLDRNIKFISMKMKNLKKPGMQGGSSELQAVQEENQDMDLAVFEGVERPQWVTEWMNATDEEIGLDGGDEMMVPNDADNNNGI